MRIEIQPRPDEMAVAWVLHVDQAIWSNAMDALRRHVDALFRHVMGPPGSPPVGMIPSMGEYDVDDQEQAWGWIMGGVRNEDTFWIETRQESGSSKGDSLIVIVIPCQPEDEHDRLDPAHPEWTLPGPTQWARVAKIACDLLFHQHIETMATPSRPL